MKTSSIIRGICFCIAFSALVSNASAQSAIVSPAGGEQVVAGSVRTISRHRYAYALALGRRAR